MKTDTSATANKVIYLADYRAPSYLIHHTFLDVELTEDCARVSATLNMERNSSANADQSPHLLLNAESMKILAVTIDGRLLEAGVDYEHRDDILTIFDTIEAFELKTQVEIYPAENTSLMGLYKSRTMFCTQCEAEGFRKITPYIDRPDVLSLFTTQITADNDRYPVLLSNGNLIKDKDLGDGRRCVTWQDPHPKPAYLFALVAGDLEKIEDKFVTASGREVALQLFVEEKDLDKCAHGMRSLKSSMRWDEEVYGREYDLDIFMIVAVDDFNMGAMENKGLNIFNTSAVLANPKTTTDMRFQWVEAVVAHEYFHNWSGNRVTCRDWFQLSLKEGFTVYRDSQFSSDMNSAPVKRIEDVKVLRAHQFAEDGGPLAHAVQPASYEEINNFYTLTIYEKGAEIVRMQANLLGKALFRKGTDLYFDRHDGSAVTIQDFVACMEEVSGIDLTQFCRWYSQAGTPEVSVTADYDASAEQYRLHFTQHCRETAETAVKQPYLIPIRLSLVGADGLLALSSDDQALKPVENSNEESVFWLTEPSQTLVFDHVKEKPVPSLLRDFSAPVALQFDYQNDELIRLLDKDTDGFVRWDSLQTIAARVIDDASKQDNYLLDSTFINAIRGILSRANQDPAMAALLISLPTMESLLQHYSQIDLDAVYRGRHLVKQQLANALGQEFAELAISLQSDAEYQPNAEQIGRRALKNQCLMYWMTADSEASDNKALAFAKAQYDAQHNMTDVAAVLVTLLSIDKPEIKLVASELLADFYHRWQNEGLVVNQWLAMQASASAEAGLQRVKALLEHPAFEFKNPNKARSLIGGFAQLDPKNFHHIDGSGYEFLADNVLAMDKLNPQIASRLIVPLTKWAKFDEKRQTLMREQLERITNDTTLSSDLSELASKALL